MSNTDDASELDANPFKTKPSEPSNRPGILTTVPKSELYYDFQGKSGLAIIFNHYSYVKGVYRSLPSKRAGTDADAVRLKECFEELNMSVEVCRDYTYDKIIDKLQTVANHDHSQTSCLVIVVMTHGESGNTLLAADRPYMSTDLWNNLTPDKCPSLQGKPKLFFIQACRGKSFDDGAMYTDAVEQTVKLPTMADFLIMYSTLEDHVAWRETDGSWFIKSLCQELELEYQKKELLQILTAVNYRVAYFYQSFVPYDREKHEKKQMPQITSMLTKLVKFQDLSK